MTDNVLMYHEIPGLITADGGAATNCPIELGIPYCRAPLFIEESNDNWFDVHVRGEGDGPSIRDFVRRAELRPTSRGWELTLAAWPGDDDIDQRISVTVRVPRHSTITSFETTGIVDSGVVLEKLAIDSVRGDVRLHAPVTRMSGLRLAAELLADELGSLVIDEEITGDVEVRMLGRLQVGAITGTLRVGELYDGAAVQRITGVVTISGTGGSQPPVLACDYVSGHLRVSDIATKLGHITGSVQCGAA